MTSARSPWSCTRIPSGVISYVHLVLDTPAWLTVSQLSTQTTPSLWFRVLFLALLLRDMDTETTDPGILWVRPDFCGP